MVRMVVEVMLVVQVMVVVEMMVVSRMVVVGMGVRYAVMMVLMEVFGGG